MLSLDIPGQPVAFARTRMNASGFRYNPRAQRDYGNLIKLAAQAEMSKHALAIAEGPVSVTIKAEYVTPKSWPKKKSATARWRTSKPDLDNLLKISKDSMTGIVYRDDAQVALVQGSKEYGPRERLLIVVTQL